MPADELISTSVEYRQGVVVVVVEGDVDLSTAPILHRAICEALAEKPSALVLDFSGVKFFACAGLRVLSQTRDEVGGSAALAVVSSSVVSNVIRFIRPDATILLCKTVDEALASVYTNIESRG
jgi:anti-sigma B factor antagonist